LTPEIVRLATARAPPPDILITVDNGIASVEEANRLGYRCSLPTAICQETWLPEAAVIVNPN